MYLNQKVVVVMPAYNAERTLEQTVAEIDRAIVDEIVLVDDCSQDRTSELARSLGLHTITHQKNMGYGGNQKSCYRKALQLGADLVIMVHPDYQYTPKLIPALTCLIGSGLYDISLGSRILGGGALLGGMPMHKYVANRILTAIQNLATGMKLSEFHTGYRAFTRKVLLELPLEANSDDFVFDNQMLLQAHFANFRIAEVTCPTKYFAEASSINLVRSIKYGFGCLGTTLDFLLAKAGFLVPDIFEFEEKKYRLVTESPA